MKLHTNIFKNNNPACACTSLKTLVPVVARKKITLISERDR